MGKSSRKYYVFYVSAALLNYLQLKQIVFFSFIDLLSNLHAGSMVPDLHVLPCFSHNHEFVGKGKELGDRWHSSKTMVYKTHITLTVDPVGKNLGPIADFK